MSRPATFEQRVRRALAELERGDYANQSRDYGRGVADACRVIRDRIGEGDTARHREGVVVDVELNDAEWPGPSGDA